MPEERLLSISSSSHLTPDDVARHSFGTVRRGFDPNEVRAYLESLAVSLRGVAERERRAARRAGRCRAPGQPIRCSTRPR